MTKSAIERLRFENDDDYERAVGNGERLTRALVAGDEREIIARIIDPEGYEQGQWWGAHHANELPREELEVEVRQFYREALAKADAILEHFAAMALGEGT